MSLDRLINLAERTGDRLIVHNLTEDHDAVILSIDEYENLIDGKRDVRGLSGGQMLDQINRDIAVWRANKEQDEDWEKTMELEDELWDEEMRSQSFGAPWENDWHSAGSVLKDRYGNDLFDDYSGGFGVDDEDENDEEEGEDEDIDKFDWRKSNFDLDDKLGDEDEESGEWRPPRFDNNGGIMEEGEDEDVGFSFNDGLKNRDKEEIKVEDIPFGPSSLRDKTWEEEPLPSDEPVFYEEPV